MQGHVRSTQAGVMIAPPARSEEMNTELYSHKRPRRLRAKYTHRTNLAVRTLCISPRRAVPRLWLWTGKGGDIY